MNDEQIKILLEYMREHYSYLVTDLVMGVTDELKLTEFHEEFYPDPEEVAY